MSDLIRTVGDGYSWETASLS